MAATSEVFLPNSDLYICHFIYAGVVERTLSNVHGFLLVAEEQNFLCASSILRLQIDTAMRANAFRLVDDREDLAQQIFHGKRFSAIRDRDGHKMTDWYLRGRLTEKHRWIKAIYNETSGSIHLSNKHVFASIGKVGEGGEMNFEISGLSSRRVEEFVEMFAAFEHSLRITIEVLYEDH